MDYKKVTYNYIKLVLDGIENKGKLVNIHEGQSLVDRSTKIDCHKSLFRFPESMKDHVKQTGGMKGYDGNVLCSELVIDFDGPTELPRKDAVEDARDQVIVLGNKLIYFDIDPKNIQIDFSGRKGFHVTLNPRWFGLPDDGGYFVPNMVIHIVKALTTECKYVDFQIYHKMGLIRIRNTKHPETNLYKIPLSFEELKNYTYEDLTVIAKEPKLTGMTERNDKFDGSLSCFLEGYKDPVSKSTRHDSKVIPKDLYGQKLCILDIMKGVGEGERDACAIRLATHFRKLGFPSGVTLSYLRGWNQNNTPPLTDEELQTKVASTYDNISYDYGCKDEILRCHCKEGCYLTSKKDVPEIRIWTEEDMYNHYLSTTSNLDEKIRVDFDIMPKISKCMRGLRSGELLYIAARAGVGKSRIAQHICQTEAKKNKGNVLMVSLEMPIELVFERSMSIEVGDDPELIEVDFESGQTARYEKIVEGLSNFYVTEQPALSLEQIQSVIERIGNVRLVAIDYLGLIDEGGKNDYERVSAAAYGGKNLAKALKVPVIMLAQLSRAAGDGTIPVELTHLRDSGKIEESADVVIGMWKDPTDESHILAKSIKVRKGKGESDEITFVANSVKVVPYLKQI